MPRCYEVGKAFKVPLAVKVQANIQTGEFPTSGDSLATSSLVHLNAQGRGENVSTV